jgi:hypothetical protein
VTQARGQPAGSRPGKYKHVHRQQRRTTRHTPIVPPKEATVKTALRYLNPHAARARLLKTPEQDRKERGFSMIAR